MTKKASHTVASISIFGRFSVEGRGKYINKDAFSNDDAYV